MEWVLLVASLALFAAAGWMVRYTLRGAAARSETPLQAFSAQIQKDFSDLRTQLQEQTLSLHKQMGEQFVQNTRLIADSHRQFSDSTEKVQNRLGELQEATKNMVLIGRDIASLQDILKAPKLRGGLGEFFLEQMLAQILPRECYELQYGFKDGAKVDAAIRIGDALISVDAKFPLENFRRMMEEPVDDKKPALRKAFQQDVKKHISDISEKYIRPQEGTYDFALMYIPAENVYYEIIVKSDNQAESLSEFAMHSRVVPVSPNSFYAYLQSIARGLKGLRIEHSALQVLSALQQLETDFRKMTAELEKVGGHLGNAQSAYERVVKGFDKIQTRLSALGEHSEHKLLDDGARIASQEAAKA